MKKCRVCKECKPPEDFHRSIRGKDGLAALCKGCEHLRSKKKRQNALLQCGDTTKVCINCNVEKPITDFITGGNNRTGRMPRCKPCHNAWRTEWRNSVGRDGQRVQHKLTDRMNKWRQEIAVTSPKTLLVKQSRNGASKRGISFSVSETDIPEIPESCPITELPLVFATGKRVPGSITLDRIDSSRGYEPGNLAILSWRANALKGDGTLDEFKAILTYMKSHK